MQESVIYRSIQEETETRAAARKQKEIALNLLRGGVDINLIASSTGLSLEEVQQLQQHLNDSTQS